MIRLVLFLLVIGLALFAVARVMAVFRNDPKKLPPPEEATVDEPMEKAQNDSADDSKADIPADSDDGPPKN